MNVFICSVINQCNYCMILTARLKMDFLLAAIPRVATGVNWRPHIASSVSSANDPSMVFEVSLSIERRH